MSGNFSYRGVWRAARDICQGQIQPAHRTAPTGRPNYNFCSVFYTATPIVVAKGTGGLEAPNALCPEDSQLQPGPLLLISGERVEFNPHFPTPSTRSSTSQLIRLFSSSVHFTEHYTGDKIKIVLWGYVTH